MFWKGKILQFKHRFFLNFSQYRYFSFKITNLQTRIHEEDKLLEKHINELINEWNKSRPVKGAIRPKDALAILINFEDKFKRLKDEQENIVKAKNALEISESVVSINQQSASKLELAIEELEDLSCIL